MWWSKPRNRRIWRPLVSTRLLDPPVCATRQLAGARRESRGRADVPSAAELMLVRPVLTKTACSCRPPQGRRAPGRRPPRRVRVRVLERVERIGGGFYAQFELVVGAIVADENRDGVCVLCPEERLLDARVLALGEHPSGGRTGGGVIVSSFMSFLLACARSPRAAIVDGACAMRAGVRIGQRPSRLHSPRTELPGRRTRARVPIDRLCSRGSLRSAR
jgi:hypothetical protein